MSMSKNRSTRGARFKEWLSFFNQSAISLPMIVFGVLAVAVLAASTLYQENLQRSIQESIGRLSEESQIKTQTRFEAYVLLTRSGIGLLQSSQVSNESWNDHLKAMQLDHDYPAVRAIGYSTVSQGTSSGDSLDLQYIYPDGPKTTSMLSMLSQDDNMDTRATVREAAESGSARVADAHSWKSADGKSSGNFLYMFTPVYTIDSVPSTPEERLRNLDGVIFVVIDVETLFKNVYKDHDPAVTGLSISQNVDDNRIEVFASENGSKADGVIRETRTLDVMGQRFYYDYEFSRSKLTLASQHYVAVVMPFIGLMVSLLLAMVISFTLRARNQRLSIAREREIQAAKDELLSLASHQLRTPATGVKQYLGMVIQGFAGSISDTQRDFLDRAYSSNERQLHIINDILYLAKLDAGRIVLTKTKFDLAELVRSITEDLQETAREAQLTMKVNAPKKAAMLGDSHMMRMVIENLITNAIKYTDPEGEVTVQLIRAGDNYSIKVTDTGVGIASEDIPKLFQQFTRIPNERSNKVSGTGVGLYLARSLTEMHGGTITVKSKLGVGTTFTIIIPRGL